MGEILRNREYLSAVSGTLSVSQAPSTWSALLGTTTVVSSTSTDGPSGFANQGSMVFQPSISKVTSPTLLLSGDLQSSSASPAAVSLPAADGASKRISAKTESATTVFEAHSSEAQRDVLAPDPIVEVTTLLVASARSDGADDADAGSETGSARTASPASPPAGPGSTPLRLQPATAIVSAEPSEGNAAAATPNKIALENMKQGNPISEWGIDGDGDGNIQGFATEISTDIGQTVDFKIATDSTHYRIDIYRLGYYGGDGARKVDSISKLLTTAQIQPHPIVDMSLGLIDCGNWMVSASWQIPEDAVSGVYIAKLVREDGVEGESIIPFVVRDDGSTSDIVFQTSDTTWQAYNAWGGASLYYGEVPVDPADMVGYMPPNCSCGLTAIGRASAISYNRPIITNTSPVGGPHDFIFGAEHSAIQWLEQNGYDVSYISGIDATRNGNLLLNHRAYLSVGHDEYWSAEQRANVEAARDSGVNLAFWSGNECYWKVRWESSIDGSGQAYRTMVCYKETWGTSTDPSDIGTGTWRDPRYADPGQEPENSLTGTMFTVDSYRQDTISIPYDYSNLRFWRDTDVAELQEGDTYNLVQNLLGYEWDSDVENGFRPAGLINLSLSTVAVNTYLRDYGSTIGDAVVNHSLTMYRAESGALVFGAGTVFWSWGLNANHQGAETPTDRNVQQAMVNMFADMGIQPTTLDASLILATQSTDTAKPTSTITSPTIGASFVEGQRVTVTGTAVDFGGGIIAGVEVSTDGGEHWFKATGRENWSYSWVVQASGTYTIMSRAVDDSVNLETPSAGKQVTVTLPGTSSLWTLAEKPATEVAMDRDPVELGVRFQATTGGFVQGIRFYKGFYNTGEHVVSLWTGNGTLLATGVSVNEPISGWQTVMFSTPIQIAAGTTYVASYHSNGFFSVTENYFDETYSNGALRAVDGGGVFAYSTNAGTFPGRSPGGSNYWVDVVFDAGPNGQPVAANDNGFMAYSNTSLSITAATLLANDSDPDGDGLNITGASGAVNGTVTFNSQTRTVVFTPTANYAGPASFSYSISDGRGGTSSATVSLTIRPQPVGTGLFSSSDTPTIFSDSDGASVELGVKFVASARGEITGLRYYKSAQDTGTHVGSLWTSTGQLLARATFTDETASGWQIVEFSQPISVSAGVTYVASYHSNGFYAATPNYFTASHTNGLLTAPSSAASGGNGLYAYGTSSLFPTSSYSSTNYWVDVFYQRSTQNAAPVAANDSGFSTGTDTPITIQASTLLANDNDADGDPISISGASGAVNGSVSFDSQSQTITFTPAAGYSGPASFNYSIADGQGGTASAQVSLSVNDQAGAQSLFSANAVPAVVSVDDGNPVNLGMKFQADTAGWITGIRFYKGPSNTGPHTGYLWTSTGTLLASANFINETASGWQAVDLVQQVAIQANTTYIVSYSTNGNYSATGNYFSTETTNGHLRALSSVLSGGNGVYAYGSSGLFPTDTYNSTNYYVDVAFRPQLAA